MMQKVLLVMCIAQACCVAGHAQNPDLPTPTEYQLKAAFLYNFAKFVDWPAPAFASDSAAITIGILGKDPFGADFDKLLEFETLRGRRFSVTRLRYGENLTACHILFITSFETNLRLHKILRELEGATVLTVGESENFAGDGGMIKFIASEGKIGFEINAEAAQLAGLQISSKLLRLAKRVISRMTEK